VPTTGLTPCPLSAGKWDIIGTVSPGTYVCRTGAIKLAGSIAPITGGKFKLYVMSPATIDIDRGTDVFNGVDVGSNTTCSPAVNFQVYSDAPGTLTWNGQAPHVCGTFYVPNISISMPGDKFSLTGAIIAKSFDINGAPHGIFPDNSTAEIVKTDWTMSSYREVGTTCTTNC
jgi:hypothetical protein